MLVDPDRHKHLDGLTPEQAAKMQREMEVLQRELKLIEESHGNEVLNLVLARGYLGKLLANARIVRYLGQHHAGILRELQAILKTPRWSRDVARSTARPCGPEQVSG
jgi:hypothetical protein